MKAYSGLKNVLLLILSHTQNKVFTYTIVGSENKGNTYILVYLLLDFGYWLESATAYDFVD